MASSSSNGISTAGAAVAASKDKKLRLAIGPNVRAEEVYTPFSELEQGGENVIKALVCRAWDCKNPTEDILEQSISLVTIRYRLEMDVTNGKTSIFVIFQNTEAEALLKQSTCQLLPDFQDAHDFYQIPPEIMNLRNTYHFLEIKTHTYIDHDKYESFVCNRVLRPGPSMRLGIMSWHKRTLPSTEFEAGQIFPYYRNGDPKTENHVFVSAAKDSGKLKRNINESSEEE